MKKVVNNNEKDRKKMSYYETHMEFLESKFLESHPIKEYLFIDPKGEINK